MKETQPEQAAQTAEGPGKYIRFAAVAAAVIVLDQISKLLVLDAIPLYDSVPVVPGFFHLTHIQNPGGAFGFLSRQDAVVRSAVFFTATAAALCLIVVFFRKTPSTYRWLGAGFALIFGGAAGNLIDRIRLGRVVDFLDVFVGDYHWPAFNVADSAVTVGIAIFAFHLLLNRLPQ